MPVNFILHYFFICILFYLAGSVPFAYLVLKLRHKKDITSEGTGNVGTMNAYESSNSKLSGIIVLILDFLKGLLPTLWFLNSSGLNAYFLVLPAFLLILGHNYSIWLKFKGGRGLASAAGLFFAVNWLLVVIWIVIFLIVYLIKRNIHIGNIAATFLLPLCLIFFQSFLLKFSSAEVLILAHSFEMLFAFSSSICLLILIRHLEPLRELINKNKFKS